jgi:hypothetical protein
MEVVRIFETSVSIYETTRRNIAEDGRRRFSVFLSKLLLTTGQSLQVCLACYGYHFCLIIMPIFSYILEMFSLYRTFLLFVNASVALFVSDRTRSWP